MALDERSTMSYVFRINFDEWLSIFAVVAAMMRSRLDGPGVEDQRDCDVRRILFVCVIVLFAAFVVFDGFALCSSVFIS
jgi:hypothetical protein